MDSEEEVKPDWSQAASELYREAFAELIEHWHGKPIAGELEFFVDELKEALLDLKFSVVNGQPSDAATYTVEVILLLAELRLRSRDG